MLGSLTRYIDDAFGALLRGPGMAATIEDGPAATSENHHGTETMEHHRTRPDV